MRLLHIEGCALLGADSDTVAAHATPYAPGPMAATETTIYVHIGAHKTGTSAIQDFAFDNAAELRRQGYFYPRRPTYIKGHHPVTWALGVPHPRADGSLQPEPVFTAFFNELEKSAASALVLSSEGFEFLVEPRALRQVTRQHRVVVLAYLRRQDRYVASMYNHHLRIPETRYAGTIDDFYRDRDLDPRLNYRRWLEPWVHTFGRENVHVRPYDRITRGRTSIVTDFCAMLGIDPTGLHGIDRVVNPSLGVYESEALRILNGTDLGRNAHLHGVAFLRWMADRNVLQETFGPAPNWSQSLQRHIVDRYSASNDRLVAQFPELGADFGYLEQPRSRPAPALPSPDALLAALTASLIDWSAEQSSRSG